MELSELVKEAYSNAIDKGFLESYFFIIFLRSKMKLNSNEFIDLKNNFIGNLLMSVSDEVSEAHDALRKNDFDNFKEELADIVIRVATICGLLEIDLNKEIENKLEKNKKRLYKHGKAF